MIRLPSSAVAALVLIWVFPVLVRSAEISGAVAAASGAFSCRGRPSGYYADLQSGCQRYYMCDAGGRRYSYACPNQTLFQQRVMICDHWFMVDCSLSESFFGANSLLGQSDKQFVADNDQFFRRTQEESALRRRPGARRPVDRTSAAYLASVAYRPTATASGAGTPAPGRVEPRTLPAAYANNPFFRGLTADAATPSTRAVTAPASSSSATFRLTATTAAAFRPTATTGAAFRPTATTGAAFRPTATTAAAFRPTATTAAAFRPTATTGAAFRPTATTGAAFRPTATTGATFRPTSTPWATFRPTSTTPPPTTTTPRGRDAATQSVHELRNRFANRREEAATSPPKSARPAPTSDQIAVTRQGQTHHFGKDAAELRDVLSPVAPSLGADENLGADAFAGGDPFRSTDVFRRVDPVKRADVFRRVDPLEGADVFRRVDPLTRVDDFTGAHTLTGADASTGADAFGGGDPLGGDISAVAEAEQELLTNTLELRLPDTRRMFFIADSPLHEAEMLRANNETVLTIALSPPLHHGAMRFKGARSGKGVRSGCPQCHPAFLLPGTCEPCVLIR